MCSILDYSIPFGNIIDKHFKSLCNLLRIFKIRIAITIMTNQHQHPDCEEDITILDIIKIMAQPYCLYGINNLYRNVVLKIITCQSIGRVAKMNGMSCTSIAMMEWDES